LVVQDVHLGKAVRCRLCNEVFQAAPSAPPEAVLDALPIDEPPRAAPPPLPRSRPARREEESDDSSRVAWIVGGLVALVLLLAVTGVLIWVVHANDSPAPQPALADNAPLADLNQFMLPQNPVGPPAVAPQPPIDMEMRRFNPGVPPDFLPFAHPVLVEYVAASVGLMGDPMGQGPWVAVPALVLPKPFDFGPLPHVELPPLAPPPDRPPPPPFAVDPQLEKAATKVYLADMQEFAWKKGPWDLGKHGALGDPEGHKFTVNGHPVPHGLSTHPPSAPDFTSVRYALGKKAQVFKTGVALADSRSGGPDAAVRFLVRGDGKDLWVSKPLAARQIVEECAVDVSAVEVLELQVRGDNGTWGAHAVWLEPRLFTNKADADREPKFDWNRIDVRAPGPKPAGKEVKEDLAGLKKDVNGAAVTELKLDPANVPGCLCWAADGRSFYYLDGATGTVGQVLLDGFRLARRLEAGQKCSWLSVSAEGLVLTVSGAGEVWLLDPKTLSVKDRLTAPGVTRAVSAPALSIAFAVGSSEPAFLGPRPPLVLDLKKGERVSCPIERVPNISRDDFEGPLLTPDGKYLLTGSGGRINRFRIDGTRLQFEESSHALVSGHVEAGVCLSLDGTHVAYPSGGGNNPPEIFGQRTPYSTYVFQTKDLQHPVCLLHSDAYPEAVGFDPKAGLAFAQNHDVHLLVFTLKGEKKQDYPFGNRGGRLRQYLVHPDGGRLLVLHSEKLYHVELPAM
jgi:hypothetical protein